MPVLLAIETSQHIGSVAVRDRSGVVQTEQLSPRKRHDDDLLPAIDRLFARCGLKPRDLSGGGGALAVSIGPGGFTGLRIAVATVKMFAETMGTRVIAVPSALVATEGFDVRAARSSADDADREHESRHEVPGKFPSALSATSADAFSPSLLIALAAKGETFWATRVERIKGYWEISATSAPGIADAKSMSLEGIGAVLADEHFPADARSCCERAGVLIIAPVFDAAACLGVAERMFGRDEFTDPLALLPLYPRQPEAVTIWEQRARQSDRAQ